MKDEIEKLMPGKFCFSSNRDYVDYIYLRTDLAELKGKKFQPKRNHALTNYTPQNNRSQLKETEDNKLIIDAYNANPTSMMAALKNFKRMEAKHKVVILGDMIVIHNI